MKALLGVAAALVIALAFVGCSPSDMGGPSITGTAHAWFPLVPAGYRDYKVTLLGTGVRYMRVTVGLPEPFFGRIVYPCVYGPVPGHVPDTLRVGLRQYYSYAPDGSLWFHGAENGVAASHTDPPVRQLLAVPGPLQAWTDTVRFTSYFPLGTPFLEDSLVFASTTTDLAALDLPAANFTALRSSATSTSLSGGTVQQARRALALLADPMAMVATNVPADSIPPERGVWFAKRFGPVAVDWPSGPTSGFSNSVTFEWIGSGTGPLPPRRTVWELGQAAVRMGPASDMAEGSSGRPQILSGLRTRSSP